MITQQTRDVMRRHILASESTQRDIDLAPPQDIARFSLASLADNKTLQWELLTEGANADNAMLAIQHGLHQIAAGAAGTEARLAEIAKEIGSAVLYSYLDALRTQLEEDYNLVRDDVEMCEQLSAEDQRVIDKYEFTHDIQGL